MTKQAMIKKAIASLEDTVHGDSVFLLSSGVVGTNADAIHQWIGDGLFTRREARVWARRLRQTGIWTKRNKLSVEWLEKDGWVGFICDTMTMRGQLQRVRADD